MEKYYIIYFPFLQPCLVLSSELALLEQYLLLHYRLILGCIKSQQAFLRSKQTKNIFKVVKSLRNAQINTNTTLYFPPTRCFLFCLDPFTLQDEAAREFPTAALSSLRDAAAPARSHRPACCHRNQVE